MTWYAVYATVCGALVSVGSDGRKKRERGRETETSEHFDFRGLLEELPMDHSTPPNVVSTLKDAQNEIVYQVMAYRRVTREELVRAVQTGLAQRKDRPRRGQTITLVTNIR